MSDVVEVATALGPARALVHPGRRLHRAGPARAVTLVLGHGAGGGVDARDLAGLAAALPPTGVTVVLVEQPWRVAGRRVAGRPAGLDQAWCSVLDSARLRAACGLEAGNRLVCGGRSAGARVACRTAEVVGADAVVALAFPLYPPGHVGDVERSRVGELLGVRRPLLVVQGGRDAFGCPDDFADPAGVDVSAVAQVVQVPHADHGFAVPARLGLGPTYAVDVVVAGVAAFLASLA